MNKIKAIAQSIRVCLASKDELRSRRRRRSYSDEENRRDEFENGRQADNNDNNALRFFSQALKNFSAVLSKSQLPETKAKKKTEGLKRLVKLYENHCGKTITMQQMAKKSIT
jgi:hypothetical protein